MYADKITDSMQRTIDETNRRRAKQLDYNKKHGITPRQIVKALGSIMGERTISESDNENADKHEPRAYIEAETANVTTEPVVKYMTREAIEKTIALTKRNMQKAARDLDFLEAARLRDEMYALEKLLDGSR